MDRVKRIHNFDDSNNSGSVGHMLIKGLEDSHLIKGLVEITEGGGVEDKKKKIDSYIYTYNDEGEEVKSSLQIKLDYQHSISGSVALEICEMSFGSGRLWGARDGNLLQRELLEVDSLVYILPGTGIYFWKPADLNRLTYYLLTNYIQEDEWFEVKNTFRLVVANNKDWLSISYLIPYYMINEPNKYRIKYNWDNKEWDSTNMPLGPQKTIDWHEALSYLQGSDTELYEQMTSNVLRYANYFGKYKRAKILESWNMNPEQT